MSCWSFLQPAGTVYKAMRKSDREEFAIKELPKRRIKDVLAVKETLLIQTYLTHSSNLINY